MDRSRSAVASGAGCRPSSSAIPGREHRACCPPYSTLCEKKVTRNSSRQMPRWLQVTETEINHFLPERSNAAEDVAAIAPDYWKPKAMVAANAKAKPTNKGKVNAPDTSKMDDKDEP